MSNTSRSLALTVITVLTLCLFIAACGTTANSGALGTAPATYTVTAAPTTKNPQPTPTSTSATPHYPAPAQVWGAQAVAASLNAGKFTVEGMTPDGRRLLGYTISADGKNYEIGWLDVATHHVTTFRQEPTFGNKSITEPFCCVTDGRYYAGHDGLAEGSGPAGSAMWFYDSITGQLHMTDTTGLPTVGPNDLSDGMLFYTVLGASGATLEMLNLATGITTEIVLPPDYLQYDAISWPYLIYPTGSSIHARDMQTGADVTLSVPSDLDSTLFGDSLFYVTSNNGTSTLWELDHVMNAASRPFQVTTLAGPVGEPLANERVVLFILSDVLCVGTAPCFYVEAWDRVLKTPVLFDQQPLFSQDGLRNEQNQAVQLAGSFLAYIDGHNQVTIYDIAMFPSK